MSEETITKESLQKSVTVVGELYPVIENQNGKVLEGNHRIESNDKWHRKTVTTKNRAEEILVRMHAHHRRRVPREETQALLLELATELEKEGTPKETVTTELYKLAPYSEGYIRELIPEKFKQPKKVDAGKVSAQLTTQTVKTCDSSKPSPENHATFTRANGLVECEIGMHLVNPDTIVEVEGHKVCQAHVQTAKTRFSPVKPEPQLKLGKPTETWEYRKAVRSPEQSKMEQRVLDKLIEKGVKNIVQQRQFCLLTTKPDLYFASKNVAVYLDGEEVHRNRTDRDDELREMLRKRYGVNVLSITYSGASDKETCRVTDEILQVLNGKEA